MPEETSTERRHNGGFSFLSKDGRWFLMRCHRCRLENYVVMVPEGICYACGYDANLDEVTEPGDDQA